MKKHISRLTYSAPLLATLMVVGNCGGKEQKKASIKMETLNPSLRYQELKAAPANAAQAVVGKHAIVHYTGWLNDGKDGLGTKFDSSVDRGEPFEFPLGAGYVIRGWDEGVKIMKKGQKIRLFIKSDYGYGARGAGRIIPPNADLIFDVELIDIR